MLFTICSGGCYIVGLGAILIITMASVADEHFGEIPLFPLDIVLFPGMRIELRIFEPRYLAMVERCVSEDIPFGIVLVDNIRPDGEVVTRDVGCSARIRACHPLKNGHKHLEVIGESRFRILDSHETMPYRTGLITTFDDNSPDTDSLHEDYKTVLGVTEQVSRLMQEFLRRTLALQGMSAEQFELPDDPEILSFLACCVLPQKLNKQQELLEMRELIERLRRVRDLLQKEVLHLRKQTDPYRMTQESEMYSEDSGWQENWIALKKGHFNPYRCGN
jgi:Lon protease-like protein